MGEIKIIDTGSEVTIGEHGSIKAKVNAVSIRGSAPNYTIQYEVIFWNGGTRTEMWVTESEIQSTDSTKFVTARMGIN